MAGIIQSIQQLLITILANQLTAIGTLNPPVNMDNTAIFWNGRTTPYTAANIQFVAAAVTLTNATTVTAARGVSINFPLTVAVTVVEFVSRVVNSIQRRHVDIQDDVSGTDSLPITVSDNAFIILNGALTSVQSTVASAEASVALGGSLGVLPTARLSRNVVTAVLGSIGTTSVYFSVVDLTSEAIASVQQASHIAGGSASIRTITISPVIVDNTILVCGGLANASTNWGNASFTAMLTDATTITLQKNGTQAAAANFIVSAVQFQAAVLSANAVQRGTTTLQNMPSNSSELANPVDPTHALCNWAGWRTALGSGNSQQGLVTSLLTAPDTQTSTINLANGNLNITSWEVVEFAIEGEPPEPEEAAAQARVMVMA